MKNLLLLGLIFVSTLQVYVVNLPLDERFTTRVAFLNLATLTPFTIVPMPDALLPKLKQYADPNKISSYLLNAILKQQTAIISIEMYLYGGLIASRISNDTEKQISKKLDDLEKAKILNKRLKIYASAVVMRIPAYDGDFQEPTFWAKYGRVLYLYSFYTDKYRKTGNTADYEQSQRYQGQIPVQILSEFIGRRQRNQNILKQLLNRLSQSLQTGYNLFQKLYISLDDNSEYGFNIAQADQLRSLVKTLKLTEYVLIYSGADQVPFTLLSKFTTDYYRRAPSIRIINRNETTKDLIPNYEGLPMSATLNNQVKAAGGNISSATQADIYLLVNNFNGPYQLQAPNQDKDIESSYSIFDEYICSNKTVGLIDNKYSNGADIKFVSYFLSKTKQCNKNLTKWTYAGWNTNGNTIGTAVSNAIILQIVSKLKKQETWLGKQRNSQRYCEECTPCQIGDYKCANSYFNLLRILQDRDWQAILRQKLVSYVQQIPSESNNHLDSDQQFYNKFSYKPIKAKSDALMDLYGLTFNIDKIYYPWNRTFEIGIIGSLNKQSQLLLK